MKGFCNWERAGLIYLSQLYNGTVFKSFSDIQMECNLPRTQFYKYLQLRHAIQAQSDRSNMTAIVHPLMQGVLLEKDKKGMISRGYSILLNSTHDAFQLISRKMWEKDLGPIEGDT